ncbi:MAG TPA: LPXTG cell wall anchor domain-containing protein [Flavobacteriaceae bacterium]|nr:LPXTG cell wall anchor domain-containing protein [Flavobacteriaceae bacterium]
MSWKTLFYFKTASRIKPTAYSLFISIFFLSFHAHSQEISASIDTASIKIGEQIDYRISVKTDSSDKVIFPEGQTFLPLEMVDALPVDTSETATLQRLLKKYTLTKFDSGTYTVPSQKIVINGKTFSTDSFQVKVNPVLVDTTKQKLYSIKPPLDIPQRYEIPNWIWWILGGIILVLGIGWLLFRRKKKKEEAQRNIPPFEKAMLTLKELDEGKLLEEQEIKTYYSILTDAARRYLDEQVDERAMESTSEELILRLQLKKDAGKLNIDQKIIDDFERILQRADLAKFARSKPEISTAREDRSSIEKIITDTKQGIPEPTEEELQRDEFYRQKLLEKQRRKRQLTWIFSSLAVIIAAVAIFIAIEGPSAMTNLVMGNSTKEMLHGQWITSEYGNPSITITTPEVLVRQVDSALNPNNMILGETFSSGNILEDLYIQLSIFRKQNKTAESSEEILSALEARNAQNIVTKKEEFTTAAGIEGQKISGSFSIADDSGKSKNKKYVLLSFEHGGKSEQILLVANKNDEYADKIISRVEYSVELEKTGS